MKEKKITCLNVGLKLVLFSLLFTLFTLCLPTNTQAAKAVEGYQQTGSISAGDDGSYYLLETFTDGSFLYSVRSYQGGHVEIGRADANGKTIWKRKDHYINSLRVNDKTIMVAVTTLDTPNPKEMILTLDKNTGKTVMSFLLNTVGFDQLGQYSADNEQLYITNKNKLYAVQYNGKKLWELTTHDQLYKQADLPIGYHEPVVVNDNVILTWTICGISEACSWIGDDAYQLLALSPKTGKTIWSANGRVLDVQLDHEKQQIIVDGSDNRTIAYRISTGEKLWEYSSTLKSFVYIGTAPEVIDPEGKTYLNVIDYTNDIYSTTHFIALNKDGTQAWVTNFNTGSILNLRGYSVDQKILYFETGGYNSMMYFVNRLTGERLAKGKYDLEFPTQNGHVSVEFTNNTTSPNRATIQTKNGAKIGKIDYGKNNEVHVGTDYKVYVVASNRITIFTPTTQAVSVAMNGHFLTMQQAAVIKNGYTYIPVRGILEHNGATVNWDAKTQTVTIHKKDTTISLKVNSATAVINGINVKIEAPAILVGSSTMLPLRFLVETLESKVDWDQANRTVWIKS